MSEEETLPEAVHAQLGFLVRDHGFRPVSESESHIRLESETLAAEVKYFRGEVELAVFLLGHEEPWEQWRYAGIVGRASLARVLEIAAEQLRTEEPVLRGDTGFFTRLAAEQKSLSEAWTAYYSGKGPRPQTGQLP